MVDSFLLWTLSPYRPQLFTVEIECAFSETYLMWKPIITELLLSLFLSLTIYLRLELLPDALFLLVIMWLPSAFTSTLINIESVSAFSITHLKGGHTIYWIVCMISIGVYIFIYMCVYICIYWPALGCMRWWSSAPQATWVIYLWVCSL